MRIIGHEILSACMFDSENLAVALERGVTADWFGSWGEVFTSLVDAYEENQWTQRNSVNILDRAGVYNNPFAVELSKNTPDWAFKVEEFTDAVEVLAGEYAKRLLEDGITSARNRLLAGDDPFEVSGGLIDASENIENLLDTKKERTLHDVVDDALAVDEKISKGERVGLPFPWINFQRQTFGIPLKAVTPLCGRDGTGKSRLATYLAHYWITQGIPVLYFPFEYTAERFVSNMAATHGQYDMFTIKRHFVPHGFMDTHRDCMNAVSKMPLYIEDYPCSAERIVSTIARYKRKYGIEGVVVDGLKDVILTVGENQTAKESHVNATLVRAAKKYDVAMLTVSHLTDLEDGKWISKRNIKGSKSQSQSARMVLVYQDAGFPSGISEKFGLCGDEIILDAQKASYGAMSMVALEPELERGRFNEVVVENT